MSRKNKKPRVFILKIIKFYKNIVIYVAYDIMTNKLYIFILIWLIFVEFHSLSAETLI